MMVKRKGNKSASGSQLLVNPPVAPLSQTTQAFEVVSNNGATAGTSDLQVPTSCFTNGDSFKLNFTNIQGLRANINCVHQHLESYKPDILVLTETQLGENTYEGDVKFDNYFLEQAFRLHRGLCVFVKYGTPYSRYVKYEIITDTAQTIVLKITLPNKIIFLISLYRSPNQADGETMSFFEDLTNKCDDIRAKYPESELVIVGDFNAHHREWLNHTRTNVAGIHAKLFSDSHDLTQIVGESTFICPNSKGVHILDLCLTSIPYAMKTQVESGIGSSSSHCLVTTKVSINIPPVNQQPPRRLWHFKRADNDGLKAFFNCFPWEKHCFYNNNINDAVSNFTQTVLHGMMKYIPSSIHYKLNKNRFSPKSRRARKKCRAAHRRHKTGIISNRKYKRIRKQCHRVCNEEAKKDDMRKAEKATQYSISDRNFYQFVASVANNSSKSSIPPLQRADGFMVTDSYEKANLLADTFSSHSSLSVPEGMYPPSIPYCGSQMNSVEITEEIVLMNLKKLDINKSTGPDGIPARILKCFADELAPIITKIFLHSYKFGVFPNAWKSATIQPIPKRGDKTDPSNYRPISIIPIIAKVFEKCINEHIVKYLEMNKLISDKQYGFRGCRSTSDLLTYVTTNWITAIEQEGEAYAIALDISKAFDKVWHTNLINKIVAYGFDSKTIAWIKSFLKDRKISVVVDGCSSSQHSINAGVPQGSVLSPTLFLLYINDLLEKTVNPIHSFADDSTLHSSISFERKRNLSELNLKRQHVVESINSDLSKIFEWGESNLVKFNETKTQFCAISRSRSFSDQQIKMNNHVLESCKSLKLLGVQISSNMKWNDHVMTLVNSSAKKLGFLNRCRKFFNSHQVLHIYKAYIRPCLEYCCQVWGAAAITTLNLLNRVQRRAVRIIRNPRLTEQLDSLQHRREVADLCVFYKYFNGKCSDELSEKIPPLCNPQRNTRGSTNAHRFTVELRTSRTWDYNRNFFVRAARKWNTLPGSVFPKEYNMGKFKKAINDHLREHAGEYSGSVT